MRRRTRNFRPRACCEPLENRQLLSLTVEVRNADGSASATINSVGQVVNLQVLAVIRNDANLSGENALQNITGSFIATGFSSASVGGSLSVMNEAPFAAGAATPGAQQDLNGDGNLDVGSTDRFSRSDYFIAAASTQSAAGVVVGDTTVFQIAILNYKVTSLKQGGQTTINFVPYRQLAPDDSWTEGGANKDDFRGNLIVASPFTISDPGQVPPPVIASSGVGVPVNSPSLIYEMSGSMSVDPIDPASVRIFSLPAHGSAAVQSDGTILYSPDRNYLGDDSFQFTAANIDGQVTQTPSVVDVSVNSLTTPFAADRSLSTFANNYPVQLDTLATTTASGTKQSIVVTQPAHGIATVNSNGAIQYQPDENYVGADSFTYRVVDVLRNTSTPATVTVTVAPTAVPDAVDDLAYVAVDGQVVVNLLANDLAGSLAIANAVEVQSFPDNGTLTSQFGGDITYTPNPGYTGRDSFDYMITDIVGDPSNLAMVTVNVGNVPPTVSPFTAAVLTGQTSLIDVLSHVTLNGGAAVAAQQSSVEVFTAPTQGTATVNADGSILYTPAIGFVGADSFTYAVADRAGGISSPATVTVDVGVGISNAKNQNHQLSFTDAAGGWVNLSLNRGTAGVFFSSNATLITNKNGIATLSGSGLNITHFALGNTTRTSVLTIRGSTATPLTLGQISDNAPLGSIVAPTVNVTGDITLNSAASVTVGNISNSSITIGNGPAGKFSLTSAAVTGSAITSAAPITSIKAASWSGNKNISAPAIVSLVIQSGGLAANVSTGALGVLRVGGSFTGNINAGSAKSITIAGDINGAAINITGHESLGKLSATSLTNASVTAAKIQALSLGNITTDNGGTHFGISADSIGSIAGVFGTTPLRLDRAQLKTPGTLQAYLHRRGIDLGDFEILFGAGGSDFGVITKPSVT